MEHSNSFYYFFSATPQVLAAILALFGVFVIFKLQSLSVELIAQASRISEFIQTYSTANDTDKILEGRKLATSLIMELIHTKNLKQIKYSIEMNNDPLITKNLIYQFMKDDYDRLYADHQSLRNETIYSTIFTAIIIIICLGIIPFGKWLILNPVILFIIFGVVIICIGISFYKLISILIKSFK
jgi:hypothetical protein